MQIDPGARAPTPPAAARPPDATQVVALASGLLLSLGWIALQATPERGAAAGAVLLAGAAVVAASAGARTAFAGLRNGRITPELLVAIVVAAALAAGDAFAAAGIAFVGVAGKWLEIRLRARLAARQTEAPHAANAELAQGRPAARAERALSFLAGWYTPLTIALAAGVLAVTDDVAFALTLLLVASPQAMLVVAERHASPPHDPRASSRAALAIGACAALFAAALLGAALAGVVGALAVAVLQQVSALAARIALGGSAPAHARSP